MITTCIINCGASSIIKQVVNSINQYSENSVLYLAHGKARQFHIPTSWTVLTSSNFLSLPRARNYCLEHVSTDYVLWLDDDIVPTQSYEQTFVDAFTARVGIVGYDAVNIRLDFEDQWYVDPLNQPYDYFDAPYAVSVKMINDIGNYDERLGRLVGGNTDLSIRAKKSGWKLESIVNPGLKHYRRSNQEKYRGFFSLTENTIKSHIILRKKHGEFWKESRKFTVDPKLQFPDQKKRYGGPEWLSE